MNKFKVPADDKGNYYKECTFKLVEADFVGVKDGGEYPVGRSPAKGVPDPAGLALRATPSARNKVASVRQAKPGLSRKLKGAFP